jgi:mediator of RNA polymerase II transcription subunit 30
VSALSLKGTYGTEWFPSDFQNQIVPNIGANQNMGINNNMNNMNPNMNNQGMVNMNQGMNQGMNHGMNNNPMNNQSINPAAQNVAAMTLTLQTPQTPVAGNTATANTGTINQQQKEFNVLSLCRVGQETVQDILSRFQDIFGILKNHQPPNGLLGSGPISHDKRQKMQDQFRTIRLLFKRLRLLYEKCDNAEDYTQVESLIPFVDDTSKPEQTVPIHSEEFKRTQAENEELTKVLAQKNAQLKEIIDNMRSIIWEINSMMSARKS